jgi:hypothetical protein
MHLVVCHRSGRSAAALQALLLGLRRSDEEGSCTALKLSKNGSMLTDQVLFRQESLDRFVEIGFDRSRSFNRVLQASRFTTVDAHRVRAADTVCALRAAER